MLFQFSILCRVYFAITRNKTIQIRLCRKVGEMEFGLYLSAHTQFS